MFRLANIVRHYDWGSTSDLPALLGIPEDGRPYAEMWFNAHPSAPSQVVASRAVASVTAPGDLQVPRSLDTAIAAASAELNRFAADWESGSTDDLAGGRDYVTQGRETCEIGWVGPLGFYQRTVGATVSDRFVRLHKDFSGQVIRP